MESWRKELYTNLGVQDELYHHGIKGQKWGVRRFQNSDGSLTPAGKQRYGNSGTSDSTRYDLRDLDFTKRPKASDETIKEAQNEVSNDKEISSALNKKYSKPRNEDEAVELSRSLTNDLERPYRDAIRQCEELSKKIDALDQLGKYGKYSYDEVRAFVDSGKVSTQEALSLFDAAATLGDVKIDRASLVKEWYENAEAAVQYRNRLDSVIREYYNDETGFYWD